MSLGKRIKKRRTELGMTQLSIAEQLKMGRSNFGHIENGRVIPTSTDLEKIAEILNTTPNYLLGNDTDEEKAHQNEIPKWATKEDIADFRKMLEDEQPVLFDGIPIEGEKRQRVIDILSGLFWEEKLEQDKEKKD
ncbi:transcriptional regulator with XRE-family HTH domain [Paenibacillus pabuli]|uniref:Transcriptional regulator with XRE-family HTH domain n=1 Tax=Paenibacillus pabuli TaxID=1472 RepID=A0ABX9BEY4_9BACL|nr:helix-turn-helix domain-containing protein [Paenibacillus pabuli]RAI89630.1 transcriptional regulator with XRE-family HTH domain [Paenibacillus pabuli]